MNEKDFNDLIKSVNAGDEKALEKIYNFYAKKIKYIANSILSDSHYAEDVLQNVMIILWNKSKRFLHIHSPDSLIYRLTKNASLDIYRSNKRRNKKNISLDKMHDDMHFEIPIEADFFRAEYMSIISSFDKVEKEILHMKIVLGLTHKEISEELKMPIATVKSKYLRVLKKLQINFR